ncbi:MAG: cob(I)yrinic acid a,c-diamide adenosyltransferase [Gammaproteobacteria bacterium]|nr:cob(I)yrinic acid a,c-diamide adenosyltransferase [Gammaproteobacteria bacterium]MCW8841740.1 cob(I)yrinic acid a,c-diamide adenosyltransferase [Gammaproteobacteria bacterium]MCW8927249.1 cob(I)yrinic acid a,c-diamide adenosyltransferase [Gammaproteobacteria bacterium]MCW8958854.1 cob(I)yrinic acid a,c-diamide adenosyltransferase [Gammaproteobacteria bacterium]MCW8971663.1 cob(I)yrinic acid a,c-diamide adenosyltransferase [Gammaproteobacteria bacterium]
MGHRLSKIYTRTGDSGTTGLGDGSRVEKDHIRIEAFGTVDELNSAIGLVRAEDLPEGMDARLNDIQHRLFDLGGELSVPGHTLIGQGDIDALEQQLDAYNAELPMLKEFILPAGGRATAHCHLARTICRRAERRVYTLSKGEKLNSASIAYLNRLSDLLFVIARVLARFENGEEVLWEPKRR